LKTILEPPFKFKIILQSVTMLNLTVVVFMIQLTLCGKNGSLSMYNDFFQKIRKTMEQEKEDIDVLNTFEQDFYTQFINNKLSISSSTIDLDVSSEINTIVNAYKYDEKLGTYAYGSEQDDKFVKILISGAKGAKSSSNQISTLSLSERVKLNQTANAIVYASKISDTDYIIDAKVNEAEGKAGTNEKGQYIMCKSVGRRYIFDSLKSALAMTKMYRLAIGSDYVKFEINFLLAGAAVKTDNVVSKSTIKIMAYIITNDSKKVGTNLGLFTSENVTNDKKSVSTHFGFLRIEKKNSVQQQQTDSKAVADSKSTEVSAYFLDFLNSYNTSKK